MTAYYNENDLYCAAWLRNLVKANLIAPGDVDERDIRDVVPADLRSYDQCHFFAGIGGWSLALRLANWPDDKPVWTGSCPCQPFSSATRGRAKGMECQRHLWPEWRRLIDVCHPVAIFGEQVDEAGAWMDGVCADLETVGYTIRAKILPAYSVGQDHVRERIYFAGYPDRKGKSSFAIDDEMAGLPGVGSVAGSMVQQNGLPDRMATLRAFGNAIVPQVAAEFIIAALGGSC